MISESIIIAFISDIITVAIIAATPAFIASCAGLYVSLRNKSKIKDNSEKIQQIHIQINSRLDELLLASSKLAHAEGQQQEREEAHTRDEAKEHNHAD